MNLEISAENMSKVFARCEALQGIFRLHYDFRDVERVRWFAEIVSCIPPGIAPGGHGATPDEATAKMLRKAEILVPIRRAW